VILDTSLLIAAERGTVRIEALLASLGDESVGIAAITASDLLRGCHRAKDAGGRARRLAFVEALLDTIPVAPFGLVEARRHAELWAELSREGEVIGPHDMLIGATALARGDTLATLNAREFRRIAGLRLVGVEPYLI
jgi:predicted nucleic acid-binding protein